jgi:hypothetical protein
METTPLCHMYEQQISVFHVPGFTFRGIAVQPYLCPLCQYVELYVSTDQTSAHVTVKL